MMPKAELTALVEDLDAMAARVEQLRAAEVTLPIYRCKWCKPYRYFVRDLSSRTMYVSKPEGQESFSDGICKPCYDKEKAKLNLTGTACSPDAKGETHRAHRDPCALGSTPDLTSRGGVGPLTH